MTPDSVHLLEVLLIALCFCVSMNRITSGMNRQQAIGGCVGCGFIFAGVVSAAIFNANMLSIVFNGVGAVIICTTTLLTAKARFR